MGCEGLQLAERLPFRFGQSIDGPGVAEHTPAQLDVTHHDGVQGFKRGGLQTGHTVRYPRPACEGFTNAGVEEVGVQKAVCSVSVGLVRRCAEPREKAAEMARLRFAAA